MPHLLLISSSHGYRHAAIVEHGELVEFYTEKVSKPSIVGNIYKGRVVRVLPGMQSAFVEIGLDRAGFLYAGDFHLKENSAIFQEDFDEIDNKEGKSNGGGINEDLPEKGIEEDEIEDHGMASEGFALTAARSKAFVPPDIEEVLKVNEDLLVQVVKDPIHGKGARLTSQISIPGRYLVFFPFYNYSGISRRITSVEERMRLKGIAERLASNGCGVIIRTAAEGKSENEIAREFDFLKKTFASIDEKQRKTSAPALIFEDLDLVLRSARDYLKEGFDMMIIDNVGDFRRVKDFAASYMPEFLEKIKLYEGDEPLFEHYGVYYGVSRALERVVWLKSGGTIVIDHTEALTTVDVNTSRFTGKRDLEETILKTNLEAVREIAFQLRLRNIGGIIVIDFIDMKENANREKVYSSLVEELKKDRAKTIVLPMSEFGLVEMTRKRVKESLIDIMTTRCSYCEGKGYHKSKEMIALEILRRLVRDLKSQRMKTVNVYAHPKVAEILLYEYRTAIEELEYEYNVTIKLHNRDDLHLEQFYISS